jgi:flavin-binding protein dodecin
MPVAKVIEISSSSTKGFDDAVREGIERASDTVENVTGAWIKEQQVVVENKKVTEFRVNLKVTFLLKA